ncbi:MAG TPA: pyridoxamine 5'-phosphate oxidase family protein [Puia sp.]|nr:pyridoxamine 5'-phosphate oxidase family protein [Puia sp.]
MFGILSNEEIEEVLKKQFLGRIGCHADNITYVVPIIYAYHEQSVYCHTQEGMKIKMMRKNPYVCFEVDAIETMGTWKSVIAWGKFEELTKPEEREKGLKVLLDRAYPIVRSKRMKITEDWPFLPNDLNSIKGIVFKIPLDNKTGRFEISDDDPFIESMERGFRASAK